MDAAPTLPPRLALLRLSAIGDVAHTVAVVRTLQSADPTRSITWLVGRVEAAVAALVPGVEVVVVDKRRPLREAWRLRGLFAERSFDTLLNLQVSLRSNLISLGVPARRRIGFDSARSKEGHGWVINERIPAAAAPGEHVLEGLMRFATMVGAPAPIYRWDLALPSVVQAWADELVPRNQRLLAFNVCASKPVKDWRAERFAAVIRHARTRHGLSVALCGGRSAHEAAMAAAIAKEAGGPVLNLVGQTSLPQLIALLRRAVALVSPDSGPVHLATAVGRPSIGLYGATNVARCGPSMDRRWCIDRRSEAARRVGRDPARLGWAEVVPGGMDLIQADDVIARLDELLAIHAD